MRPSTPTAEYRGRGTRRRSSWRHRRVLAERQPLAERDAERPDARAELELLGHAKAAGIAEAPTLLWVGEERGQSVGQRVGIVRSDEAPGLAIDDCFWDRRDRADHDRNSGSHGLEDHVGEAVAVAVVHHRR